MIVTVWCKEGVGSAASVLCPSPALLALRCALWAALVTLHTALTHSVCVLAHKPSLPELCDPSLDLVLASPLGFHVAFSLAPGVGLSWKSALGYARNLLASWLLGWNLEKCWISAPCSAFSLPRMSSAGEWGNLAGFTTIARYVSAVSCALLAAVAGTSREQAGCGRSTCCSCLEKSGAWSTSIGNMAVFILVGTATCNDWLMGWEKGGVCNVQKRWKNGRGLTFWQIGEIRLLSFFFFSIIKI